MQLRSITVMICVTLTDPLYRTIIISVVWDNHKLHQNIPNYRFRITHVKYVHVHFVI